MWIVKGALLGILLFIVGGLSYIYLRKKVALYLYAQAAKAGRSIHGILPYYSSTDLMNDPRFWITLCAALAVGLWIMRPRRATS